MKILVGLGNPGPAYARQRHNIGFMAIDAIVAAHGIGSLRRRFQGEAAEGRVGGEKVLVLKPQTYMNESGRAVGEAMRFYKAEPGDVTVLHDEIDLAAGKVRVKTGGGAAGHNGLRSIAAHIGPEFRRVRIGIGHPGDKALVHHYVLGDFAKADAAWLDPLLDAIAAGAGDLVAGKDGTFMNRCAGALGAQAKTERRRKAKAGETPGTPATASPAPGGKAMANEPPAESGKAATSASAPAAGANGGAFALLRRLLGQGGDRDER